MFKTNSKVRLSISEKELKEAAKQGKIPFVPYPNWMKKNGQ